MKVFIYDNSKNKEVLAEIEITKKSEMPSKSKGWKFSWRTLSEDKSIIYKLSYESEIQGLLKVKKVEDGYIEMSNLELAPHNFGKDERFSKVAGCLIAFACLLSFELNEGNYQGFLSFTSKGELIKHYEDEYNAELVYREKMIIFPKNGRKLIKKYLKIEI